MNVPVTTPRPADLLRGSSSADLRVSRPETVSEQRPELRNALDARPTVATTAVLAAMEEQGEDEDGRPAKSGSLRDVDVLGRKSNNSAGLFV